MHNMPAISIVIPLYNAQTYIPRFVHALQRQTLHDFEALFVDDASTDESASIVQSLAVTDSRLKLLRHPANLGAGAARNLGIRTATGETLCFADPDDLLPNTSLEVRHAAYKQHGAVVRACHVEQSSQGKILHLEERPPGLNSVCAPKDAAHKFGANPFLCAHWTWLFPTKMLQRLGIYNEEHMRTAEDIMFLIHAFYGISKLVWIEDIVYRWIKREDSLSNTFYTVEHYLDYFRCVEEFYTKSIPQKKALLADSFFNDYLSCYIPHLLKQVLDGKSSEQDAQNVFSKILQLIEKYNILHKYAPYIQKRPLQYIGFFRVWHLLADQSPSLVQRLIHGQNFITRRQLHVIATRSNHASPETRP